VQNIPRMILILILLPFSTVAESEAVWAGDAKLAIPLPEGFHKASQADLGDANSPSMPTKVLAIYIPDENPKNDEYGMERYIDIQVPKLVMSKSISHKEFASMKRSIEDMTEQELQLHKNNAEVIAQKALDKIQEDEPESLKLHLGEIRKVGIFTKGNNHIGFSILMRVDASMESSNKSAILVQSQIIQFIKDELITLNSTSEYRSSDDLIWSHQVLKNWRESFVEANQ